MSTPENTIDLTGSDDECEKQTKKREAEPEVKAEKTTKKTKKAANKCGICEEAKQGLKETGNMIGYVCEDCMDEIPEMAFCDGCGRYEETDGENLCGTCQFE